MLSIMFYLFPKLQELINPHYKGSIDQSLQIMIVAIIASFLPWQPVRMWGRFVLLLITYGIVNDLFACRACPEYFTVGHFYDGHNLGHRLLKTMDPTLTALVWGLVVTATLGCVGSIPLAFKYSGSRFNETFVMKCAFMYLFIVLALADIVSRTTKIYLEYSPTNIYMGVPANLQAGWHATNVRNSMGYIGLIGGGLIALIL